MVELSSGLLIWLVGFGAGALTTLVLVLLVVIYHNTVGCNDKKEEEPGDDPPFIIPMSQIAGAGHGGYTMADVQRASAAMRNMAGPPKPPEEPTKPEANTGTYL